MTATSLPQIPGAGGRQQTQLSQFGGYNHTLSSLNGQIYDMENLTGDHTPVLASRPNRWIVKKLAKPNGLYCASKLFLVDGTSLTADGVEIGQVADSPKTMMEISGRLVVFPDKMIYTKDGKLESLEASYSAAGLAFSDGTYADQPAKANSIITSGAAFPFKAGDAVTITGCEVKPANNKTPVVREVSEDGKTLRFYENVFDLGGAASVTEPGTVTLSRTVPDMDFFCCNENRLWGCKGDSIYASKLGDPYNWNVFDGVSTDSYSVETGTPGEFTACCSYLGYPVFFKEDKIFKVYGDRPTNFQVMSSATLGVMKGSHKSLAIAGETLYYLSRAGITAYSGGIPRSVSQPFGGIPYKNAVAGSDGVKYVVSLEDQDKGRTLFVYNSSAGVWHKEDHTQLLDTGYLGGLYGLSADGSVLILETPTDVPADSTREPDFESWAEFGDFTLGSFDSKYPFRLWIRFTAAEGVALAAEIQYNASGVWEAIETAKATRKTPVYMAVPIQRCDFFRLRLRATGEWRLWDIEFQLYDGNYVRK